MLIILVNYMHCLKSGSHLQSSPKQDLLFTKSISVSSSLFSSCSNSSGKPPGQNGQLVELPLTASLGSPGARRKDMEFFAVCPISSTATSRNRRSFPVVGSRSTYKCKQLLCEQHEVIQNSICCSTKMFFTCIVGSKISHAFLSIYRIITRQHLTDTMTIIIRQCNERDHDNFPLNWF